MPEDARSLFPLNTLPPPTPPLRYELVDMIHREAALQLDGSCGERGQLVEALRARYVEFFAAALGMLSHLQARDSADGGERGRGVAPSQLQRVGMPASG